MGEQETPSTGYVGRPAIEVVSERLLVASSSFYICHLLLSLHPYQALGTMSVDAASQGSSSASQSDDFVVVDAARSGDSTSSTSSHRASVTGPPVPVSMEERRFQLEERRVKAEEDRVRNEGLRLEMEIRRLELDEKRHELEKDRADFERDAEAMRTACSSLSTAVSSAKTIIEHMPSDSLEGKDIAEVSKDIYDFLLDVTYDSADGDGDGRGDGRAPFGSLS